MNDSTPHNFNPLRISVVIPALNEEQAIGKVIDAIPDWVDEIVVADNGSTDQTATVAKTHRARVIHEPQRGYGKACLSAIAALDPPDVIVFLDGDASDDPTEMGTLVEPLVLGQVDMVIGSRATGHSEQGALFPQQQFGNWFACFLMRLFYGVRYTDLGPFRAITASALHQLKMDDENYGWTIQMQTRAAQHKMRTTEVPVSYKKRIGQSKVSGTIKGVVGAGTKIMFSIFNELRPSLKRRHLNAPSLPCAIHLFTRLPKPGQTKTRMISELGPEGAAQLQQKMTEHAVNIMTHFAHFQPCDSHIWHTGNDEVAISNWLGKKQQYHLQCQGDLGQRMNHVFQNVSACKNLIMGADCPQISHEILRQAFAMLDQHDLVIGPTSDGGYYLIAMKQPYTELFDGIEWGSESVYQKTIEKAEHLGLSIHRLEQLNDIDRPEDLPIWLAIESNLK